MANGAIHLSGELLSVKRFALLAIEEHFRKRLATREAADVGGENTGSA